MYIAYKKADEGPVFSTVLLFSCFFLLYIGLPIAVWGAQLFSNDTVFIVILLIVYVLGLILIIRRYNKKRINEILIRYRYHMCNKWLKNWMIYAVLVLLFPMGLFTIPLSGILFNFIRSLII